MKGGNEFSQNVLRADAQEWIGQLYQALVLKEYGKGSIKSYVGEMTLLFKYFNQKQVTEICQQVVEHYQMYIKEVYTLLRNTQEPKTDIPYYLQI